MSDYKNIKKSPAPFGFATILYISVFVCEINVMLCFFIVLQGYSGNTGMKGEKGVPGIAGPRVSLQVTQQARDVEPMLG